MNLIFRKIGTGIEFIQRNPSIIFSLLLLVLVPVGLFIQTIFIIRTFEKNVDFILQEHALTLGKIIGGVASDFAHDRAGLQERILSIGRANPEIAKIQLFSHERENDFRVVASKKSDDVGALVAANTSLLLSWGKNQAFAYLTKEGQGRFWNVVIPFGKATKDGLVTLSLSLATSDALILKSIQWAYIALFAFIFLILFLIVQHTRLFQYVFISHKLEEVDEMKEQFIRMAIHELQAPMVNVRSYLITLADELKGKLPESEAPDIYQYVQRGIISAERLVLLIEDMLQVSRIERGGLDLTPEDTNPRLLVSNLTEEFKQKAEIKGLALEVLHEGEEHHLWLNPNRLGEVLANLIGNALKYTAQGKVLVRSSSDEARKLYSISVEDTGIGISAEEQQKLFTKFYRVRNKETANISGTGLGLWIAKTLTEQMGGKIFIESVKGTGSRFSVVFPFSKK